MRGLSGLGVLVLVGASLVAVGVPAGAAAAPTCDGRKATIVAVGQPGREVNGTGGDDVIVATDTGRVYGHGGDDRICLRGTSPHYRWADGGAGDDRILVEDRLNTIVVLGSGDDRFEGGPGPDQVLSAVGAPGEHDVVRTGAGNDRVTVRKGTGTGASGADIRLGSGDDLLEVNLGGLTRQAYGGPGYDGLSFPGSTSGVTIDNRTGGAELDGEELLRWSSFAGFQAAGDVTFVGGAGLEHLETFGDGVLSARMGGGPDLVLSGSCTADVRGDNGDDKLRVSSPAVYPGCDRVTTFLGGPGDDALIGGAGDDSLDGGDGADAATGRGGVDTCVAETVTTCEA